MEKNVKVLETKVAELAIVGTNRTPRGQLDKSGALSGQKLKAIKKSKEVYCIESLVLQVKCSEVFMVVMNLCTHTCMSQTENTHIVVLLC